MDAAAIGRALAGVREQLEAIRALKTQLTSVSNATQGRLDGPRRAPHRHPGAGRGGRGRAPRHGVDDRRLIGVPRTAGPWARVTTRSYPWEDGCGTIAPSRKQALPAVVTGSPPMQRIAPLTPLFLVAALVGSFIAPAAAAADPGSTARTSSTAPAAPRTAGSHPTGRWIVLLRDGASVDGARSRRQWARRGRRPDIPPRRARLLREAQRRASSRPCAPTPTSRPSCPTQVITLEAQSTPRGVRRVFGPKSPIARIDGIDQRVDADVAIVDTGIDKNHGDLNVVGGVNCSSVQRDGVGRRERPRHARRRHRRRDRQRQRRRRRRPGRPPVGRPDPQLGRRRAWSRGTSAASTGSPPSATPSTRAGRSSRP